MIIDAHLHLDEKIDGTAKGAASELDRQLAESGIAKAIVLHLETQPWSAKEFAEAIAAFPRLEGFINVHPYAKDAALQLQTGINKLGFIGLKLHPRLQKFSMNDQRVTELVKAAGDLNIPVLFDAFPDGTHLMQGFSPLSYAGIAKECNDTRIIWAHMGGHYVLDFMMLAKRLPNVYMDMSYSLLYYQTSSVTNDMVYAMRSMKFERIFYGSDYPDRPVQISLLNSLQILREKGVTESEIDKMFYQNAAALFKWNIL